MVEKPFCKNQIKINKMTIIVSCLEEASGQRFSYDQVNALEAIPTNIVIMADRSRHTQHFLVYAGEQSPLG